MQLLIAINCSARKTAAAVPALRARSLPRGTAYELAEDWRARCSLADRRIAARRLYAGRSFSLAYEVGVSAGAQLRVVSAGMGLLHPETTVPAYDLTLSAGTRDCILGRGSEAFTSSEWWQAIRSRLCGAKPFERLLATYPRRLLLLALTRPYLEMITEELAALSSSTRERIRILGPTRVEMLPEELRPCVMPYDARLNDVDRDIRGTSFDFPSRALVHFAELVKHDRHIEDTRSHARRVRQSLAHWAAPELKARRRIGDSMLHQRIRALKKKKLSRTAGLRHLRDELGLACEQARFMAAWDHQ